MIAQYIRPNYGVQSMAAMGFPDDDSLYRAMERTNPWWTGRRIPDALVHKFRRSDYADLMQHMEEHPVQAILGARQVGKTTLLYQAAAELVAGSDPRRVMFLSLDEPSLFPSADNLRRMLDIYGLRVLGESMYDLSQDTYVILDEVQAVANWQQVVKAVVDRRGPLTFIVSGSSSADIFGVSESLVGRIRHQSMAPMSFCEALSLKGYAHAAAVKEAGAGLRGALAKSVEEGKHGAFHSRAADALVELAPLQDGLKISLSEYMLYGGCPGIVAGKDSVHKARELKGTVRSSMYNDVLKVGSVRSPRVLEDLFQMLAEGSPRLISKDKMLRRLGINKATLDAYLYLLEATYLLSYSHAYSASSSARVRSPKKAYVNDVGIRNAALSMNDERMLLDPTEVGMLAETVACGHTRRLWESIDHTAMSYMPRYWRTDRGCEVDLVMSPHRRPVPIEVKYRQHVDAADLKGLSRFVDRYEPGVALALTQDRVRLVDDAIVAIPLWLYLVMCG